MINREKKLKKKVVSGYIDLSITLFMRLIWKLLTIAALLKYFTDHEQMVWIVVKDNFQRFYPRVSTEPQSL
jgi:hypothetical protein